MGKSDDNINVSPATDDEFDYLKEIEAIEAQERELDEQRRRKKAEMEAKYVEEEQAKVQEKESSRGKSRSKRDMNERRKEAEWLGEDFDDDDDDGGVAPVKKARIWKKIILVLVVLLIIGGAVATYWYNHQQKEQTISDFSEQTKSFELAYLSGGDVGSYAEYFESFIADCNAAIDEESITLIDELNERWVEVAATYDAVMEGKSSLDDLQTGFEESFEIYYITEDYEEDYETLKADIEAAVDDCAYDQVSDLQSRIDSLLINLKADNMKYAQTLKNEIDAISLDETYMTEEQSTQLTEYSDKVTAYESEGNYALAIATLKSWKSATNTIADAIAVAKEEAESESKAKAESESIAKAESESKAKAESESKAAATTTTTTKSSSSSSSSSSSTTKVTITADYVLPDSNTRYLTASDVSGLSKYELMIARNEIYARHGRKFKDASIQAYFNSKSWYKGTIEADDFSTSVFNDYEIKNIALIQSYE